MFSQVCVSSGKLENGGRGTPDMNTNKTATEFTENVLKKFDSLLDILFQGKQKIWNCSKEWFGQTWNVQQKVRNVKHKS